MASSGGRERSNTMETKDRIRRTLVEPVTFADIEAANADYIESDNGVVSRSNTTQATPSGRTRQAGASASGIGAGGDGQRSSTYSGGAAPPKPKRSGRSTVVIGKRSGAKIVIKKWGSGGSKKDLFGSAALAGASSADDAATTATAVTATASTASGGRPARPLPSTSTEASPEDASPLSNSPSMEDLPVKDRTSSGSGTGGRPAARRTTEDEDNSEDDDGRRDTADSDAPPDRKPANRKLQTLKSEKGSKRLSSRLKFWTHKKTAHSEATLSTRARVSARSFSQEEPIGAGRGRVATTSTADGDHDGDDIVIEEADDDTPAHFEEDRDDLVFMPVQPGDRRMRIKGGTMEALVERLTYEKYPDPEFMQDFLLTYRSFTTPTELMQMVFERFNVAPPPGATEDEIDEFVKTKQFPIRFRVCNVLKYWVSEHFRDFQDEPGLVDLLRAFVDETLAEAMPKSANQLSRNLQNMIFGEGSTRKIVTMGNAPKPVVKKAWLGEDVTLANTDIAFMDMDPLEVARQLTIIEYAIYRSIKPMECVNKRWSKSAEEAPHLIAMARRFNSVSNWVASEIISAGANVRARASVLKRFIEIAARCRDLNNFNACMEIIAGVHTASISRLKKTWEALNRSTQSTYQALEELTNQAHNYAVMRATIPDVDPPLIPYVGMFLTDLTFIEDGMKDQVGDLTNFAKLRRISVVIRQIQLYQNTPYNLAAVPVMQEYFENLTALSDDELYARSLEYEPRPPRR